MLFPYCLIHFLRIKIYYNLLLSRKLCILKKFNVYEIRNTFLRSIILLIPNTMNNFTSLKLDRSGNLILFVKDKNHSRSSKHF